MRVACYQQFTNSSHAKHNVVSHFKARGFKESSERKAKEKVENVLQKIQFNSILVEKTLFLVTFF